METTPPNSQSPGAYDIVIRGGVLFDGTGAPGQRADIAVAGDRIAAVGDLSGQTAARVIDAAGLHVAPGFIDIHTHSDVSVTYNPGQTSAVAMGVTTQVVGNCGLALGFATDSDRFAFEKRWLAPHGARITWSTFGEHLRVVEEQGVATNYIPLAGHGTLRKRVIGMEERAATRDEMLQMQRTLAEALEAGAWGLSSGLEYPPSSYAGEDELAELCDVVRAAGGIYATHLRNEGDTLVEAVQEALNVTRRARVPLQLSHHKAEGARNWGKVRTTLDMVSAARAEGIDVQTDQYPYTAFMTGLAIQTLPPWAQGGTAAEMAARLKDPEMRARITADMLRAHPDWADTGSGSSWHNIRIGVCRGKPELQGSSIAELADRARCAPIPYVLDLIADTSGYISAVNFAIGEADIAEVMRYPWTSIGSDGVGAEPGGAAAADRVHPRAYGTFPRVLGRYVRELGVLTEEEAIYKMTALPAARLAVPDRGTLATGKYADITVYDPDRIVDRATFDEPHQLAEGVRWVVINGRIALSEGGATTARAGRVLRHAHSGGQA